MIELPKDAEGREIPLNTETLYTDRGPIFRVEKFEYVRSMGWCIYGHYDALCGLDSCGTDVWQRLADLIDRPTCHDLVEHKQDPFIPGKRMVDGYFHCSDCGWDGRIWEHIGFGDMLAYEAVHCPKCGAIIKRCA